MKIKYRSPMHLDRQNAQLGTNCRLKMGLMIGTTCLYSNFASTLLLAPYSKDAPLYFEPLNICSLMLQYRLVLPLPRILPTKSNKRQTQA